MRSLFVKLRKPKNKSQDTPRLLAKDERNPGVSISGQPSNASRLLSIGHSPGDDARLAILVPSQAPTTPESHTLGNRDVQDKEVVGDSNPSIGISSAVSDHSAREARNEDRHQTETTLVQPSVSREGNDVYRKEVVEGKDPELSIPTNPSSITREPLSLERKDEAVQGGGVSSMSFFQDSSNVKITRSNFDEVRGNATIIRFGNGEFTHIQRNLICDYFANLAVLPTIDDSLKKHVLSQSIISLPRAEAVFNDYKTKKKSGPCFEGTRVALLREMGDWITGPDESRMYVLSGLAGIGKSTVVYTIASRAADLNLLGASFFFSRDDDDRNNAKQFFTTIAYQLCVFDETFAQAIGDVLGTKRGSAAITKDPQEQMQVLILNPLRRLVQSRSRPILIIVDALDECDEADGSFVLTCLSQLVRDLPSVKVILTTRPQPYPGAFLSGNIFHLQDIEDKVVDSDIRIYLKHCLALEQVEKRHPKRQWCANDEEIRSLVRAAGRLFIIASTAVRYILDKAAANPAAQMKKLLLASAQDHTPFKDLNDFYTIILRNVVPLDCNDDSIINRYKLIVGAIILVRRPLPASTLARLVDIDVDEMRAVLDNLQSVILLGNDDVPRIYHKSFPDYLTDQTRCKDPRLQIDPKVLHTQIAVRCFEIMDHHLKYNILDLGDPARFMSNEDGLKEDGITDEKVQEKIPLQLRYACEYWANHVEDANIEDTGLLNGLEKFTNMHLLHYFEVLSLIGKLGLAHHAIRAVINLLKSMPNLRQFLSEALRFISKFYKLIEQSALHTYHSALPFTPTNSLFYTQYIKEAEHNICAIEAGPEKWDTLVANLSHEEHVKDIKFSLESSMFASCSKDHKRRQQGYLKIWDATTGTPIATISGHTLLVANDFSTVASSEDMSITFYNTNGSTRGTMFTTSSKILKLALSSESRRVAVGLSDGTVQLWDSENGKLINSFKGFESNSSSRFQFSPTGSKLAYSSTNGIVKLRDGTSGIFIADLRCRSADLYFEFSGDESRVVSASHSTATVWNAGNGSLVGVVADVGSHGLAISASGSLLATTDFLGLKVKLWKANRDTFAEIKALELNKPRLLAFSPENILAIAIDGSIKLYNVTTQSFISTFPFSGEPTALGFSPDSTRLAFGTEDGRLYLWDIGGIDASSPRSNEIITVTALALSRDCSRLACGFVDGRVELWMTSPKQRIILSTPRWIMDTVLFRSYRHPHKVTALGFCPDGKLFASGSDDGTIKLWNSEDGSLCRTAQAPDSLRSMVVLNNLLVVGCNYTVTMLSLDTLNPIHTSKESGGTVSIAENGALIAVARDRGVSLLEATKFSTIATFNIPHEIDAMAFLPDNSRLVAQSAEGNFLSLNLINKKDIIQGPTLDYLIQLPNTPLWQGVPILRRQDRMQHCFSALFSQHKSPVPVLWIPREISVSAWTQGSSMIALGYDNGGVMLLRL